MKRNIAALAAGLRKLVIAIYLRISQEDDAKDESNSIKNQRDMIRSYIKDHEEFNGAELIDYVDDGISGSHTKRDAYQRLIDDVSRGEVDCIIIKDLSRIGRDLIDVGDLLQNHLVALNVRFIAINNNYDSFKHPLSNLEIAVINLANQHYNRDLIEKSKSARLLKQKRGEYLAHAPFGYIKSGSEKNKLIPDEEAAGYVKMIFSLAAEGRRPVEIAQMLNAQGIPSPSVYKVQNGWNNMWTQVIDPEYCFWTNGVVYKMLKNEIYTGKAVSNKQKVAQPGTGRTVPRPKDEWIIVPGAHEPLVSEEVFQKIQLMLPKKKYNSEPEHIFGNKVKCPACGHAMTRYTRNNPRFKCGTAKLTNHYGCKDYTILQSDIEKAVLASIRVYAATIIDQEKMKLKVIERDELSTSVLEAIIRDENKAIQAMETSLIKLFTSFVDGKVTSETFSQKKDYFDDNIERKRERVEQTREQIKILADGRGSIENTVSELTPLLTIESLDKEIVNLMICKILVHGDKDIEVIWNGKY